MSRWNAVTERNRAAVAANAERILADTSYDRFRTPGALLAIVIAYVGTTVLIPIAWLASGAIAGIASMAPWLAAYLLLRVAVRSQADLPDDVLDERMRSERDRVYVAAYRVLSTVVFLAANAAFVAVAFGDDDTTITFDYESVSAVYWTVFSVLLGTPSIVLALRARARTDP